MGLALFRTRFVLAVILCGGLGSLPAQLSSIPSGTGAISGIVSEGPSGRPLSGVVVSLYGGTVPLRTITDSKGRFVFRNLLPSDRYGLEATKSGYAATGLAKRSLFAADTRFPLTDSEWISDANFVMVRLGAISGNIVDEAGEPVVNVPVRVLTRIAVAGTMRLASGPAARTDDRGAYRVPGLVSGSYFVAVQSVQSVVPTSTSPATAAGLSPAMVSVGGRQVPWMAGLDVGGWWLSIGQYPTPPALNGQLRVYPPVFFPNARSITRASAVDVAPGEEKHNVNFTLHPVSGSEVSGRVTGPANLISGLVIRLLQDGAESLVSGFEQATALVRPDGSFTMVGIPAGQYTLDARPAVTALWFDSDVTAPAVLTGTPGLVDESAAFITLPSILTRASFGTHYSVAREPYSARVPVTVDSVGVSNIVVVLQRGVSISGRVIHDDGAVIPSRLGVAVEPANGDPALGGSRIDRDVGGNPTGTFSIEGLERGEYFLRVGGGFVKSIIADGDYTDRPFDTSSGSEITDVVITVTDKPATLSGAVRDRQGAAVREGAVILFPVERALWTRFGIEPPRIKTATFFGARGYRFMSLPAGEYYVIAVNESKRHAWHDPHFFEAAAPLATRVTLAWGTPAVQDLTIRQVVIK